MYLARERLKFSMAAATIDAAAVAQSLVDMQVRVYMDSTIPAHEKGHVVACKRGLLNAIKVHGVPAIEGVAPGPPSQVLCHVRWHVNDIMERGEPRHAPCLRRLMRSIDA